MLESLATLDLNNLITSTSSTVVYFTTLIALVLNGLLNIPSSQIFYLTLGYMHNLADFNIYIAIILGAIGNTIGNYILYLIIYKNSDGLNSRFVKFLNIDKSKLEKYSMHFQNKWWGYLILGKLTPSIKVFVPIMCGLSKVSKIKSIIIFGAGSTIWALMVTMLGSYFGKQASLIDFYLIVTLVYVLIGFFVYFKYGNKKLNH